MAAGTATISPLSISFSRLLRAHGSALMLLHLEPLSSGETILLAGAHVAGLSLVARYLQWSWPFILLFLIALGLAIFLLVRWRRLGPVWLVPFFPVYFVLLSRLVYLRLLHGTIYGYFDYNPPEWGLPLLHVEASALAALVYTVLILLAEFLRSRRRAVLFAMSILLASSLVWTGAKYAGGRTAGATGSDPYAYVQMGVDLAERGTPVHRFALFPEIAETQLPWYPIVHVGYHIPMNLDGDAVTVWPPAGALAYAVAWRVLGEWSIYWVNPFFSLLSVLMAGLLAWELLRGHTSVFRRSVAICTIALTATAITQVVWAGVTMVDAQAEFFSLLALWLALVARSKNKWIWPLLVGIALGAAYDVRHTQLAIAPALALILCWDARPWAVRFSLVLLTAAAAFFVALPDLWYHQVYLGGWLHPESEELALYTLTGIGDTINRLSQEAFAANELGWLVPFLLYGLVQAARYARFAFAALGLVLVLSLALHLPYPALRLRDLLPELPLALFFVSYGIADLVKSLLSSRRIAWQLMAGLVLLIVVDLCLLRVWNTVPLVWQPVRPIFGYMTQGQRAAFNQLTVLTPQDAVVGATLNSGAVELYSHRNSSRLDGWNSADREQVLRRMLQVHSAVYVLEDNRALSIALDLRGRFRITRVGTLDVPLFGDGSPTAPGALWKIELTQ